jgi:hypothetical protein
MSMATPYECSDQDEPPVTARQLKALVLLAAMEASSSPSKTSTGSIRWMGNPTSNNVRMISTMSSATSAATTRVPWRDRPSYPQWVTSIARSDSTPTGQPDRHEAKRSSAVTARMDDAKVGGVEVAVECGSAMVVGSVGGAAVVGPGIELIRDVVTPAP